MTRTLRLVVATPVFLSLLIASPTPAQQATGGESLWVGQDLCMECHDDVAEGFERSVHGRLAAWELNGGASGCESCHGPGSAHADTGDPELIRGFGSLIGAESSEACLTCHERNTAMEWAGSTHAMNDVACSDCHDIHETRQVVSGTVPIESAVRWMGDLRTHPGAPAAPRLTNIATAETCLECHDDVRASFNYASHHPVLEGYMTCADCHIPDGAIHGETLAIDRTNEMCLECHPQHEGPWVFEHAPVEEDCTICHGPHGTVANSLLTQNEPFLCMQCHEAHFHAARVGLDEPAEVPAGTHSDNPLGVLGFMAGFNSRCSVCHPAIHGSDLPSLSVPSQGKALTR